jgi:transcriptional regulator with XRE-family HTH domain
VPAVTTSASPPSVGPLLRSWRQRRHLTQLELANESGVTTRHLSFVETGRSRPSREMVLHLAEVLEVPLRERNNLLVAAGFAPTFRQRDLGDASLGTVRTALGQVLAGQEPYPAIVVDRRWQLVLANQAADVLTEGIAAELLEPPVNVMRVSLHPKGLAPRIRNFDAWADHAIGRIQREVAITGDDELAALAEEMRGYARERGAARVPDEAGRDIAVPMVLDSSQGTLTLVTMISTFGTALDITLAEMVLESFLPGDQRTVEALNALADLRADGQGVDRSCAAGGDGNPRLLEQVVVDRLGAVAP